MCKLARFGGAAFAGGGGLAGGGGVVGGGILLKSSFLFTLSLFGMREAARAPFWDAAPGFRIRADASSESAEAA